MIQLDLWEQTKELAIGDVFETAISWADGDTSRVQLERLAKVLLGDLNLSHWSQKPIVYSRIIATRVEGDKVIATCRVVDSPLGRIHGEEDDTDENEEDAA